MLLTDQTTAMLSPEAFGAWVRVFCTMHSNAVFDLTKTVRMWSRVFGCSESQAEQIIDELIEVGTGQIERTSDGVRMASKKIRSVLEDQETRRKAAAERKKKWQSKNTDGTRSEHVPNASGIVLERSGSSSLSLSSTTEDEVRERKKKVSVISDSEHLQAYVRLTGYNPPVNWHSDIVALGKYPLQDWEAHVQMWVDTPRWNEKNVPRLTESFIEAQGKINEPNKRTHSRSYHSLPYLEKLRIAGYDTSELRGGAGGADHDHAAVGLLQPASRS